MTSCAYCRPITVRLIEVIGCDIVRSDDMILRSDDTVYRAVIDGCYVIASYGSRMRISRVTHGGSRSATRERYHSRATPFLWRGSRLARRYTRERGRSPFAQDWYRTLPLPRASQVETRDITDMSIERKCRGLVVVTYM